MTPLLEVAGVFLRLGCVAFGGPLAHLGYLRTELVTKRRWVDDAGYADLVALCQFLPGPASSQVAFGLGMRRAGVAGGLVASACFALPSVVLMIAFAYGAAAIGDLRGAGWLHGLKLAAVAVVAYAVWGMGRTLCTDATRIAIALAAAALVTAIPGPAVQVAALAAGGLVGWLRYRGAPPPAPAAAEAPAPAGRGHHRRAAAAIALYLALLIALPAIASATRSPAVETADSFYRAGALVFGGGHVVLPLLRAELVPRGWIADDAFLAGYGAAQALPGPLFAIAAYLGTAMEAGPHAWLAGAGCALAIFLPGWLLVGGALPFWHRLRARAWARAALAGANAAVVGVLLAALYRPVITEAIDDPLDAVAAAAALVALAVGRVPPWLVVIAMAAAGRWLLA